MTRLRFRMNLTPEQALRYYQGMAKAVIVTAETGQRLSFPAEHIRQFVDSRGVNGLFSMEFDDNNKLIGITRLTH
ncbi:hypothetical protein GCM10007891_13090 [Methylophaga thalassica]|uniref:DUF2835 family protein n=1 Tax=Methylophaga thalassica TaxID=40223 RepID=A0ABQ5TXB2_9GAMM|nr:DUF2835 domain-containing protein [Methylophaga thalassica]GLP99455.1 hypothetical protein GCM10007891_13090 [Methylophaga thalassica]